MSVNMHIVRNSDIQILINGSENTEPSINFILFSYESISFRSL
ncbi:hypothetical protein HMPREF0662_02122, partial [Prevotella nigrescens F0103]